MDDKADINELIKMAEDAITAGVVDDAERQRLVGAMKAAIAEMPDCGRSLGPLLAKVAALKSPDASAQYGALSWVDVSGGQLAIGHRPRLKSLPEMAGQGVSHVLSLLSAAEGAEAIGQAARAAGIGWQWLPLASAKPPKASKRDEIIAQYDLLRQALDGGGRVYLHCSAGIHRTGMIAYGFFRYLNLTREQAEALLAELRVHTAEGVGEERKQWGDQFAEADE